MVTWALVIVIGMAGVMADPVVIEYSDRELCGDAWEQVEADLDALRDAGLVDYTETVCRETST
jgi:hypothetical protein